MQFLTYYIDKQFGWEANKRFILEWENAFKPIRDYLRSNGFTDIEQVAIIYSYIVDENLGSVFNKCNFDVTENKVDLGLYHIYDYETDGEVIILDVYGSAREEQGGVSSEELVEKMKMFQQNVFHMATIEDAYEDLKDRIGSRDVVVTMGAGNVCDLAEALLAGKI